MTDEALNLSRRAVACKGWRWMPGMCTVHDPEYGVTGVPQTWVLPVSDGGVIDVGQHYQRRGPFAAALGQCVPGGGLGTRLPDLRDPATLGCLVALVRESFTSEDRLWEGRVEVHQDSHCLFVVVIPEHDPNGFLYHRWVSSGASEAEALVAALEVAP